MHRPETCLLLQGSCVLCWWFLRANTFLLDCLLFAHCCKQNRKLHERLVQQNQFVTFLDKKLNCWVFFADIM